MTCCNGFHSWTHLSTILDFLPLLRNGLRPPAHPFSTILSYDWNLLKTHVTFNFMYGYGSLKQRILCLFNWFRSYNKIASKGGVGGLNLESWQEYHIEKRKIFWTTKEEKTFLWETHMSWVFGGGHALMKCTLSLSREGAKVPLLGLNY